MAALEKPSTLKVKIRWLVRADLPQVLAIEAASFEFPWTEEDFIRSLTNRHTLGMVAEFDGKIVGYYIYRLHKYHLHVLNIATHPYLCFYGIGRQMLAKLIEKISLTSRKRITLEVRETNLSALLFFKACGFKATEVLRNYYDDSPEDAIVMKWRKNDHEMNG